MNNETKPANPVKLTKTQALLLEEILGGDRVLLKPSVGVSSIAARDPALRGWDGGYRRFIRNAACVRSLISNRCVHTVDTETSSNYLAGTIKWDVLAVSDIGHSALAAYRAKHPKEEEEILYHLGPDGKAEAVRVVSQTDNHVTVESPRGRTTIRMFPVPAEYASTKEEVYANTLRRRLRLLHEDADAVASHIRRIQDLLKAAVEDGHPMIVRLDQGSRAARLYEFLVADATSRPSTKENPSD